MATGKHGFTDEDLEGLSDEEREGLINAANDEGQGDDEDTGEDAGEGGNGAGDDPAASALAAAVAEKQAQADADAAAAAAAAKAAQLDLEQKAAAGDATAKAALEAKQAEDAAKKKAIDDAAAAADEPGPAAPALVEYKAPENAAQRLADIRAKQDELDEKNAEGELEPSEFRKANRALIDEEQEIREQMLRANLYSDQVKASWTGTAKAFMAENQQYTPGGPLTTLLDVEVRKLQTAALLEGKSQYNPKFLEAAHKTVMDSINAAVGAKPTPKTPGTAPKNQREIPPTLSGLPASDPEDVDGGGEFAHLDRLANRDPLAFEAELDKMSEETRERYLAQ